MRPGYQSRHVSNALSTAGSAFVGTLRVNGLTSWATVANAYVHGKFEVDSHETVCCWAMFFIHPASYCTLYSTSVTLATYNLHTPCSQVWLSRLAFYFDRSKQAHKP